MNEIAPANALGIAGKKVWLGVNIHTADIIKLGHVLTGNPFSLVLDFKGRAGSEPVVGIAMGIVIIIPGKLLPSLCRV